MLLLPLQETPMSVPLATQKTNTPGTVPPSNRSVIEQDLATRVSSYLCLGVCCIQLYLCVAVEYCRFTYAILFIVLLSCGKVILRLTSEVPASQGICNEICQCMAWWKAWSIRFMLTKSVACHAFQLQLPAVKLWKRLKYFQVTSALLSLVAQLKN